MSLRVVKAVLEGTIAEGAAQLIALRLANYADDEGRTYVGQERLAFDAGLSDRAVRRAVAELKRLGELKVTRNPSRAETGGKRVHTSLYRLQLDTLADPEHRELDRLGPKRRLALDLEEGPARARSARPAELAARDGGDSRPANMAYRGSRAANVAGVDRPHTPISMGQSGRSPIEVERSQGNLSEEPGERTSPMEAAAASPSGDGGHGETVIEPDGLTVDPDTGEVLDHPNPGQEHQPGQAASNGGRVKRDWHAILGIDDPETRARRRAREQTDGREDGAA